ncbi:hypothetical protein TI05_14480, partial [Achromatium sp. WMS3]
MSTSVDADSLTTPSKSLNRSTSIQLQRSSTHHSIATTRFGFQIGDIGLLIPIAMVSEVVVDIDIYPLPTTPKWFRGLINLRGSLVPIFDLKTLFDIQTKSEKTPRLLVLNERIKTVGILVDTPPKNVAIGQALTQTPPLPQLLNKYSHG